VPEADWATCIDSAHYVVPAGGSQCISFAPNLTKPTTVRVTVPVREVKTTFAALLGVHKLTVGAQAHATLEPGGSAKCGLCVLGTGVTHDLQNGDATIHGAGIHFNGNVSISSNGLVATDGDITVEGTAAGSYTNYTPDPLTGQIRIPDPLRALALPPDLTGLLAKTDPCGTGATHGPGIYGARDLRGRTCTLQPGLYVIAGNATTSWDLAGNNNTRLEGAGVTLYFTCGTPAAPRVCAPGESGATMDASGSGLLSVQAPASGPLQGLVIVYDRQNTSTLRVTGGGSDHLTGTIYMSSGSILMNGNGCSSPYNSLIVIKELAMDGNGACLQSSYTRSENVQIPPSGLHLSR
jgi:hypothetical protein